MHRENPTKRKSLVERKTRETEIKVELYIDGTGKGSIDTSIPFLNHMLESFAKHGVFDLKVKARGDIEIDSHHTSEDTGITLGEAFKKALGDKKGISRTGCFTFPMDEALAFAALDISGRSYLHFEAEFKEPKLGDLDSCLIKEFFWGLARGLAATLHIKSLYGDNGHHIAESIFKAFAKAMKMACSKEPRIAEEIPSTKGVI